MSGTRTPATGKRIPLNEDRDPLRWANEFNDWLYINGGSRIDQGVLIGWFANAMMCGEDTYRWKLEKEGRIIPSAGECTPEELSRALAEKLSPSPTASSDVPYFSGEFRPLIDAMNEALMDTYASGRPAAHLEDAWENLQLALSRRLPSTVSDASPREEALAEALQLVLDDWANGNVILEDAMTKAERAINMPVTHTSHDARIALVREALFNVLDEREWDFSDDEQRVDFADRVVTFLPSAKTVESDATDAERYRWLRSRGWFTFDLRGLLFGNGEKGVPEILDDSIDRARSIRSSSTRNAVK